MRRINQAYGRLRPTTILYSLRPTRRCQHFLLCFRIGQESARKYACKFREQPVSQCNCREAIAEDEENRVIRTDAFVGRAGASKKRRCLLRAFAKGLQKQPRRDRLIRAVREPRAAAFDRTRLGVQIECTCCSADCSVCSPLRRVACPAACYSAGCTFFFFMKRYELYTWTLVRQGNLIAVPSRETTRLDFAYHVKWR